QPRALWASRVGAGVALWIRTTGASSPRRWSGGSSRPAPTSWPARSRSPTTWRGDAGGETVGPEPSIELRGIDKWFGEVHANRDISLAIGAGTIHGIVGENGAGKSTLMGVLYGSHL